MEQRRIICKDCDVVFVFPVDPGEGEWFRDRGFQAPVRCRRCRRARRALPYESRRVCQLCRSEFAIAAGEADWYLARELSLPNHCPECRRTRRRLDPGARAAISRAEALAI
jgi:Zn finger protein HypA/HybF involved in hydrogenase expression